MFIKYRYIFSLKSDLLLCVFFFRVRFLSYSLKKKKDCCLRKKKLDTFFCMDNVMTGHEGAWPLNRRVSLS